MFFNHQHHYYFHNKNDSNFENSKWIVRRKMQRIQIWKDLLSWNNLKHVWKRKHGKIFGTIMFIKHTYTYSATYFRNVKPNNVQCKCICFFRSNSIHLSTYILIIRTCYYLYYVWIQFSYIVRKMSCLMCLKRRLWKAQIILQLQVWHFFFVLTKHYLSRYRI